MMSKLDKGGCILIDKNTMKVALVFREYRNDISFPKGHVEDGESLIDCAIRETEEEIKRKVKLLSEEEICYEEYSSFEGDVVVHYYLGFDDGKSDNDSEDVHDLIWCDIDKVVDMLTHESTKKMFLDVKDKIINRIK